METDPSAYAERRRALRPAVSQNYLYRYEQHLAARRLRMVSIRFQADRGSRQLWALLRPRPSARARQCALVGWKHDNHQQFQPGERESLPNPNRGAHLSKCPPERRSAIGRAGQLHNDAPAYAE